MTTHVSETRKIDIHKRRSTTNVKRIALDAETNSLYDPEAPSRLSGAGQAPAWNHRTGYGAISDLNDEASRAPIPKELRELIAKWSAMYRSARGKGGKGGKGERDGGKSGLDALSDLELFERRLASFRLLSATCCPLPPVGCVFACSYALIWHVPGAYAG